MSRLENLLQTQKVDGEFVDEKLLGIHLYNLNDCNCYGEGNCDGDCNCEC